MVTKSEHKKIEKRVAEMTKEERARCRVVKEFERGIMTKYGIQVVVRTHRESVVMVPDYPPMPKTDATRSSLVAFRRWMLAVTDIFGKPLDYSIILSNGEEPGENWMTHSVMRF